VGASEHRLPGVSDECNEEEYTMDKFNTRHLIFLIMGTTIVSLKTYPTVYTKTGGRDSWIAMIVASILLVLYFLYILRVCKKHKTYSFYKIYRGALGKFLGTIFIYLYIFMLLLTLVESAATESNSMHTNMLINTPQWFFILFFVVPAIYTVKKGRVAVITVTIIGIVLIVIAGINLSLLTAPYKRIEYLFPVFKDGITKGFILSTLQVLGVYGNISILFPFLAEMKDTKKIIRDSLIGLFMVIQMEIISITGMIMTFDIHRANYISYPKLIQTQRVSLFDFLEAGELFVMLQIVGGWFIKYIITFMALIVVLKDINFKNKYIHYIVTCFVFIFAFLFSENLFRLFNFLNYYTYISLIGFVIIPLAIFVVYDLRNSIHKI
jgi:spore germination protein (amino acid permease)